MYNILVCDDEKDIVSAIKIYLEAEGYNVLSASNGEQAQVIADSVQLHLIIMDIMMPVCDGIEAMLKIREKHNMPIILLTAKSEDSDKVLGLNVGADDYVTKPFNPIELIARVRSQIRRYTKLGVDQNSISNDIISIGGVELNDKAKIVKVDGVGISLTPTEYNILKLLMQNSGMVLSQKEIYESIRNENGFAAEGVIAVHIRHLREKIEVNPAEPKYIKVVWGRGYKFEAVK